MRLIKFLDGSLCHLEGRNNATWFTSIFSIHFCKEGGGGFSYKPDSKFQTDFDNFCGCFLNLNKNLNDQVWPPKDQKDP